MWLQGHLPLSSFCTGAYARVQCDLIGLNSDGEAPGEDLKSCFPLTCLLAGADSRTKGDP